MEQVDLEKFCDLSYEPLSKPFTVDDFTYSTNGHVCIRVPRVEAITNGPPERVRVEEITYFDPEGIYKAFPEYKPTEKVRCGACCGSGLSSKCPECSGEGVVSFDNGFHEYECDCDTCHGDGITAGGNDVCKRCGGSGLVNKDRYPFVDVDELRINTTLLDTIKDLPNVKLNTTFNEKYALFVFDGGVGVVMGMNKDDD